jgi:hypothetical protein
MSHDQLTFPPKPASHASSGSGEVDEDAVLLDDTSEDGSVGSMADGWSEVDTLTRERFRDLVFTPAVWQCLSLDGTASLCASVLPIILSSSKC